MNGIFSGSFEKDDDYIRAATDALEYSEDIPDATLVRRVYGIALSVYAKLSAIDGTPTDILDGIFCEESSELSEMTVFKSTGAKKLDTGALSVGDILVGEWESVSLILIYNGEVLISPSGKSIPSLDGALRAAILRPRLIVNRDENTYCTEEELDDAKTALLATAEAYFMRGYRCQYDDSRFTRVGGGEFRWQIGVRNPEDYTRQRWGYVNCAAFTYEIYRTALGLDLGSLYTTHNLMWHYSKHGFSENEPMYPYYYVPSREADEEERRRVEKEFLGSLRIGDLAVIRRNNGNGHVLMYIGGGRCIHSSGSSYSYAESRETHEPTISVIKIRDYLFEPYEKNYIFSESGFITQLGIVRPLDKFSGEIPENTRNRVKNMRGIIAEKLSSVKGARTACTGDEITYTFKIKNLTDKPRTVEVRDSIPCGTAYVRGELSRSGATLTETLKLQPRESRDISYTVLICEGCGEKISDTGATVGGVLHASGEIRIKNTLTEEARGEICRAAEYLLESKDSLKSGAELVNEIYVRAGLAALFDSTESSDIEDGLFVTEEFYVLKEDGKYAGMIPHGLYGGRNLQTENRYTESCKVSSERVRLPRSHDLMRGDVVIARDGEKMSFYLYTGGERLLSLTDGAAWDGLPLKERIEGLLAAYNYFVVLRI